MADETLVSENVSAMNGRHCGGPPVGGASLRPELEDVIRRRRAERGRDRDDPLPDGLYESRDFSAMPILADALQDSGCANEQVLTHCRDGGPHVRGCWVVDAILGKS